MSSGRAKMGEIASSAPGRDITRPWIGPLAYPGDWVLNLKGGGDYAAYVGILTDDQVKSGLQQRFAAVVNREWRVEPGGSDAASKRAADWLREQIAALPWDRVTEKMLYGVFWGHAVGELLYARDGAYVGIDQIKARDRARFVFDREGRPRLLTAAAPSIGEELPERKFWTYATGAIHDDDPYGLGLAHWLHFPVLIKRQCLRFWLGGLEKEAEPTMVGEFPPDATQEDQDRLLAAAETAARSRGVIHPVGMILRPLLEAARGGTLSPDRLYNLADSAITKVILSQTMTTEDGASRSQAEVHERVADAVAKSDADLISASFNDGPVRWLTEWNFPGAAPPRLWRVFDEALEAIVERDSRLAAMGVRPSLKRVKEVYGEDYELAAPAAPPPAAFAEGDAVRADPFERSFLGLGDAGLDAAAALFGPIGAAVEEAQSMEDLGRRLDTAGRGVDPFPFVRAFGRHAAQIRRLAMGAGEGEDQA